MNGSQKHPEPSPIIWHSLTDPTGTFSAIARSGTGFQQFLLLLCIEALMLFPDRIAVIVAKIPHSPVISLISLFNFITHFAILPITLVLASSFILHYVSRYGSNTPIPVWNATCVLAYAWTPHTLLLGIGTTLSLQGWDISFMPHRHLPPTHITHSPGYLSNVIQIIPSLVLAGWAIRTILRPHPLPQHRLSKRKKQRFDPWVLLISLPIGVALIGNTIAVHQEWAEIRPLAPGNVVPHFEVRSRGGTLATHADLAGRVTLIDFWATWCAPCIAAMPHLNKLHQSFEQGDFRLISICADPENQQQIDQILSDYSLDFPIYEGAQNVLEAFRVDSFPTLLVINRQGRIEDIYNGSTSLLSIRNRLQQLLEHDSK